MFPIRNFIHVRRILSKYSSTGINTKERKFSFSILLFTLFEVRPILKGVVGYRLVSLRLSKNHVFKVYIDSWKKFKPNYFLAKPLSSFVHEEFCFISSTHTGQTE